MKIHFTVTGTYTLPDLVCVTFLDEAVHESDLVDTAEETVSECLREALIDYDSAIQIDHIAVRASS